MISTKELTIGCYVKVNGKPHKVDEVFANAVGLEKWDTLFHYSDLEPIPITKELLLKNGFVEDIDEDVYFISRIIGKYKVMFMWLVDKESDIYLHLMSENNKCIDACCHHIQYVHQAQTFCNVLGIELEFEIWK